MKNLVLLICSLIMLSASIASFYAFNHKLSFKSEENIFPRPTETPEYVNEEGDKEKKREAWIEAMHRAAPGTDWRSIEAYNHAVKLKERALLKSKIQTRGEIEYFGDSALVGQWHERGAKDVTGSQVATDYDPETDYLYSIGAGGPIFKGKSDGTDWHVLNQEYQFDQRYIRIFKHGNQKRIVLILNKKISYSDNDGQDWVESGGQLNTNTIDNRKELVVLNDPDHSAFFLTRENQAGGYKIRLYRSLDQCHNFSIVKDFGDRPLSDFSVFNPANTDDIYMVEHSSSTTTKVYKWNILSSDFDLLNTSNLGIGNDFTFKPTSAWKDDHVRIYLINKSKYVFMSDDYGASWQNKGVLPVDPWDVGIFTYGSNPNNLLLGEVECYRSVFSGAGWEKVNGWGDYYGNVKSKLHADMMHFNEFKKVDGSYFAVICCHGGIFKTTNYTTNVTNITLTNLNNAQYYDVTTQPGTYDYIYAGAQDQGFQRGKTTPLAKDAMSFKQIISGDYGHNAFTNNGTGLWTVYPGGSVSYYQDPKTATWPTAGYEIVSDNETVWIPPLIAGPNPNNHTVFVAGGNKNGGAGSYIIELSYEAGGISANQLPFDFKASSGSEISAIRTSPLDDQRLYVATNNGNFYLSEDAGQNWYKSTIKVPGSHYLYGAGIYASRFNKDDVYVCGSGYSNPGVLKSDDGGVTFKAMNNGLPSTLVFNIVANDNESLFFAATEAGPYVYVVAKDKWFDMSGLSAPTQTFWSVEFIPTYNIVRFGTYGRGIWDFRINDLSTVTNGPIADNKSIVFPNPFTNSFSLKTGNTGPYSIEMFSNSGQLVHAAKNVSDNLLVEPKNLRTGMYYVKINSNGKIRTEKIQKI